MKKVVMTFDRPQDYETFLNMVLADISPEKGTVTETEDTIEVHIVNVD